MSLFSSIKSGFNKFSGFLSHTTPGDEVARGFGISLMLSEAEKSQEELDTRHRELQNRIITKMKEAKDKEKKERYGKILRQHMQTQPNVLKKVLEEAPTNKQVIASAAELGLTATLGFRPGVKGAGFMKGRNLRLVRNLKRARKLEALKGVGKIERFTRTKGLDIAREALLGSGIFATIKAQEKDATTQDIVRAAGIGGAIGGVTTGVFMGIAKGIGKISPKIGRVMRRGIRGLEEISARKKISSASSEVGKTLATIGAKRRNPKQYTADMLLRGVQAVRQFKARFIDRFHPIQRMEDTLTELKGRPLTENEKIFRNARLLQSTSNYDAETKAISLMDELREYDDVLDQSKAYLVKLDFIDRAKLGQKVPRNKSLNILKKELKRMVSEVGPEKMVRVNKVREIIGRYNKNLLQERINAGLITQKTMDNLLKSHPNYIPHNVLLDVDDRATQFLSNSYNVPKTDIMKAVGSVRDIQDPFVAMIQRTPIATKTITKNRLLNNMVKAQEKYNVFPGMKKISSTVKPKRNFGKINLFKGGKKEIWQVPSDIETAIKNIDAPIMPGWFKIATTPQRALKAGATKFNLSFTIPNKFRDKQTALLTAESFMKGMAKKTNVSPKAVNLGRKQLVKLYRRSGGYGASIFKEGEEAIFKKMRRIGVRKHSSKINPFKLIENINERIEQSTRLKVFRRALERGFSPKDAALISRDASIDFARMGSWMKWANKAVPFLNARVQGFVNLPRAFASSPETFARMQMYSSVYPTVALHSHNRRFKSYDNVSQYYKNKYWIIMTGEEEAANGYNGEKISVPQFIAIPKGEGQSLVSSPIQAYLDKMDGRDYRKTSEIIADTLGSASPLEFQSFDQTDFFSSVIAQLGPLATIPYGLGSNKHPYFGTPIIPKGRQEATPKKFQVQKTTPEVTRELAGIINVSPARLEFVMESFGGLGRDLQESTDLIFGLVKRENIIEDLKEETLSETSFGLGSKFPVSRRFLREANEFYGPESEFRKRQKEELKTEIKGGKLEIRERSDEIFRKLNKIEDYQERKNYLSSLGDELTPKIKKRISYLKKIRQSFEVLKKTDSVELRARYLQMRLDEMEEEGIPLSYRVEFLREAEKKGILTPKTKKMMKILQKI